MSTSLTNFVTLAQARTALGEQGTPIDNVTYTLSFANKTLSVSGIEASGNTTFDASDHVLSLGVVEGLDARTSEGLGIGSTFAQIHAVARFANPDRTAVIPAYGDFTGGKMDEFFKLGIFIGYDATDQATVMTVIRPYKQPPDGTLDPAGAAVQFGTTLIEAGDGYQTGSLRSRHRAVLGDPDWYYSFSATVDTPVGPTEIQLYLDSYRILGLEFLGGDDSLYGTDINKLVAIAVYPLFYGRTAAGHGLGSTKAEWESELGAPVDKVTDPNYEGALWVYNASADHRFAVIYSNGGAAQTDVAVYLVLNYQTG